MSDSATRAADPSTPVPTERCATHTDAVAIGACARCGDFYCRACEDAQYAGTCRTCAARLPHGIAWEDSRAGWLGWRFVLTIRDVMVRPQIAFPGPKRPFSGLGFGLLSALLAAASVGIPVTLAGFASSRIPYEGASMGAMVGGLVVLMLTLGVLTAVLAEALSFALTLTLVGRSHGLLSIGLRTAGYAQASLLVFAILEETLRLALGRDYVVFGSVMAVGLIPFGRLWFASARGLGLSRPRALVAALPPTLLLTAPLAWLVTRPL
ncbi:MAG: hypothetical protein AB7S26_03785 [Sandaracinaceae bacterium]